MHKSDSALEQKTYESYEFFSEERWGFPKIGGKTPKWMVKIMESPMNKWMIWGKTHYFRKHPYGGVEECN